MSDKLPFPEKPELSTDCFRWESQTGDVRHLWSCYHVHDDPMRSPEKQRFRACHACRFKLHDYVHFPTWTLPLILWVEGGKTHDQKLIDHAVEVVEAVVRDRILYQQWVAAVDAWRKQIERLRREREQLARLTQDA